MATHKAPTETPTPKVETPEATQATSTPAKKSNKTLFIVLGLVAFFVFIVPGMLIGAGIFFLNRNKDAVTESAVEGLLEKTTGSNIDINSEDNSFSIESENGDSSFSVGSDQKIPDDFPLGEIPYLDEKEVTFVFSTTSDGKKSWSVTTTVNETLEEANAYFEKEIAEPNFNDISTYSFNDSTTLYGTNSMYSVAVTVSKDTDSSDTSVTYVVTEQ